MTKHEQHVHDMYTNKFNKIFNNKTITDIKIQARLSNAKAMEEFNLCQPTEGERVYFHSFSKITGKTFAGYGVVTKVVVKDPHKQFALYTIESDFSGTFQAYINNPDDDTQREFVYYVQT